MYKFLQSIIPPESRPILSDGERALSLLSLKYVSDVVLHAPLDQNEDFYNSFNVTTVVYVENHPDFLYNPGVKNEDDLGGKLPKFVYFDCEKFPFFSAWNHTTTDSVIGRILNHRDRFEMRNSKKKEPGVTRIVFSE